MVLGRINIHQDITLFFNKYELDEFSKHGRILGSFGEMYDLDLILGVLHDETGIEKRGHELMMRVHVNKIRQLAQNNVRIQGSPSVNLIYTARMDANQKVDYEHLKSVLG